MPEDNDSVEKLHHLEMEVASSRTSVDAMRESVETLQQAVTKENGQNGRMLEKITEMSTTLKGLGSEMKTIAVLVRDGNGQPPLMTRVTHLEANEENIKPRLEKVEDECDAAATARVLSRGQIIAGAAGIAITVILSLVTTLLVWFQPVMTASGT